MRHSPLASFAFVLVGAFAVPKASAVQVPILASKDPTRTVAAEPSGRACSKKFNKALVISGGGVAPGLALGVIAAAQAAGHKPDVIITTCGSSIGGAINNAYPDPAQAKAYVTSREFHRYLLNLAHVGKRQSSSSRGREGSTLGIGGKLIGAKFRPGVVPDIFDENLMDVPEKMPRMLPRQDFTQAPGESRLIVVGARATFKPEHKGMSYQNQALYEQTFFTDKDTARSLHSLPASIRRNFPDSPIHPWSTVKTGVSTVQAARASVADPYFINPAKIGNDYYFAGAMDLFPVESASSIACDVTITSPSGDYSAMEDLAVERGFGFSQSARVKQLQRYKGVRWIDMKDTHKLSMDPEVDGMTLVNKVPEDYKTFKRMIEAQYDLAYHRTLDAYNQKASSEKKPARRTTR